MLSRDSRKANLGSAKHDRHPSASSDNSGIRQQKTAAAINTLICKKKLTCVINTFEDIEGLEACKASLKSN